MAISQVLIGLESTSGTYLAPSQAFKVETATNASNQDYMDLRQTGSGRGLSASFLAGYAASGSISFFAPQDMLGIILKAAGFGTITSTQQAATTAYAHGCLPDDEATLVTASMQYQDDSTFCRSFRGVFFNKVEMSLKAGEPLRISLDWIALDECFTGGNWGDGNSAAAIVASPTYSTVGLFDFVNGTATLDGTVSLDTTTDQMSISGGTAQADVEMLSITIENNATYTPVITQRYPSCLRLQNRAVGVNFDRVWCAVASTWVEAMKAATKFTLQLAFAGAVADSPYTYDLEITLPYLTTRGGDLPDIVGDQSNQSQSVELVAQVDPAAVDSDGNEYDIGILLVDTQTSY